MIEKLNLIECKSFHYKNRYIKIVKYLSERNQLPEIFEEHHILPSCIFPEYKNFKEYPKNKLCISPREHFILHWILSKAFGGKLLYAYNMMANSFSKTHSRSYFISRSMYENIRKEMIMNNPSKNADVKLKISKKAKDRWKNSDFKEKQLKRLSSAANKDMVSKQWKDFYSIEENRLERSRIQEEIWKDENYRDKVYCGQHDYWSNPDNKEKFSVNMKEVWKDKELRAKQSERMKGEKNPFFGKKHTEETRIIIKLKNTGRKATEETKIKLSKSLKGKKRTDETKEKIRVAREGTNLTETTKEKIGIKAKERSKDPEYLKKISNAQKNRKRGTCAHCNKEMDICNLKRYHNDNCKQRLSN